MTNNGLEDFIFLSLGSVLGVCLRYYLIKLLTTFSKKKYLRILYVNTLATFFLALILTSNNIGGFLNSKYIIFLSLGLFGSLSTFSAFIFDIFESFLNNQWMQSIKIINYSIFSSLIAILIAIKLINFVNAG